MSTFVVHDMRDTTRRPFGDHYFLEYYAFDKKADGSYWFSFTVGWVGAGHYDGAGNSFELPGEWFSLSWESFLDSFSAKYKEDAFGISRSELRNTNGLKEFFGF